MKNTNTSSPSSPKVFASGSIGSLGTDKWHTIGLSLSGDQLTAAIDGRTVGRATDSSYTVGPAGIESDAFTSNWSMDQYQGLSVSPVAATTPTSTSWSGKLVLGYDQSLCLDNAGGRSTVPNKIDIWGCNATNAQKWSILTVSSNHFLLKDAAGTCLDDTRGDGSGSPLIAWSCNSSDHAQLWEWENSKLENVFTPDCVNDPRYSKTYGTQLIMYACSGSSNELWYER